MRADPPVKIHLYMTMIYRHSDNMVGISFSQCVEIVKTIASRDLSHAVDGVITWTGPDYKIQVYESCTGVITISMDYGDFSAYVDDVQYCTTENFPRDRLLVYGPAGAVMIPVDN